MNSNRLVELRQAEPAEGVDLRQPQPAFEPSPVALAPWQQQLYQAAYQRACALTAPWPPRWLQASVN